MSRDENKLTLAASGAADSAKQTMRHSITFYISNISHLFCTLNAQCRIALYRILTKTTFITKI